MKRAAACLILLATWVFLSGTAYGVIVDKQVATIPSEAITVAQRGLDMFIAMAKAEPAKWGLESASEAERAVLGEGYRIAYIGRAALTAAADVRLLSLEDTSLYPTCIFTIDVDGKPKSFITVCRIGGGEYQFADFGGDATYFGIAREAFQEVAGDSIAPILMKFGGQFLMVLEKDGKESVLPVPYDASTAAIVESGKGIVETSVLIERIQAEYKASTEGTAGGSAIEVWNHDSRQVKDSTPCMIALGVVGGICFVAYLAGIVVEVVRKRRIRSRSTVDKASRTLS